MLLASPFYKKLRQFSDDDIRIGVGPKGFSIVAGDKWDHVPLLVEVYHNGFLLKRTPLTTANVNDFLGGVDPSECGIRVVDEATGAVLASLNPQIDPYPWMRLQGEQTHITESYVSVPPALHITDEVGSVWTLGFSTAPADKSPDGEFAFAILRNGIDTGEVGSRIEKRAGKVKIFTAKGWKTWNGQSFF